MFAVVHLQRQEALHGELPRDVQFVAEARDRFPGHRVRPIGAGDEARRRAHERQPVDAFGSRQRPTHRDEATERPAQHRERPRLRGERRIDGSDDRIERARRDGRAVSVPGQVDRVDAMVARELLANRSPDAGMHRPAVQQHQRRAMT